MMSNNTARARGGTTLLEIVVICVIVAVAAGIALPATTNFFASQKLAAAAATLCADVRTGRYGALQSQGLYRLAFFRNHAKWGDGYVISFYKPTTDPNDLAAVPAGAAMNKALVTDNDPLNDETGADDWIPVEGNDGVRTLPDGLKFTFIPNPPPVVFFRADGTLHRHPSEPQPIGSITVMLSTDDDTANYSVNISTIGAVESDTVNEE